MLITSDWSYHVPKAKPYLLKSVADQINLKVLGDWLFSSPFLQKILRSAHGLPCQQANGDNLSGSMIYHSELSLISYPLLSLLNPRHIGNVRNSTNDISSSLPSIYIALSRVPSSSCTLSCHSYNKPVRLASINSSTLQNRGVKRRNSNFPKAT